MKKFDDGKLSSTCRITGIDVAQLHGVNNNPGINGEAEFLGKLVKIYADGKLVAARIRAEFRELRKCDSSRICGFPIEYHRSITVKAKTWITANIFFLDLPLHACNKIKLRSLDLTGTG